MARSNAAETKCDVCGMEALPDQAFTRDGVPFYQRRRCPNCHAKLNRQVLQGLVCVAVAMGLTGFLLIWKSPDSLFGRLLLNLFWFDLLLYLSIVPHEFAHAIAGRLAGFRITGISIGNGMTLFRVRLMQVPVTIKAIPFGGFTQ